jgi:1-aminocyclopropane-1-carboxylate deaminase
MIIPHAAFMHTSQALPLTELHSKKIDGKIKLFVKRLDLTHPVISGNKWFKLKYNIEEILKSGSGQVLSFGGAYSNHIYALAEAGKEFGFKTIGVIRGEKVFPLNETLTFAEECGMHLKFITRELYRKKTSPAVIKELQNEFGDFFLIPEGGSNYLGVKGASEIPSSIDIDYDYIVLPCGTGGTLSGIISALNGRKKALGVSVLKGGEFLFKDVENLTMEFTGKKFNNWDINLDYHFGGYAKRNPLLDQFILNFIDEFKIDIEFVYSGKMFYAIFDLLDKGFFRPGETIIALHTGGLR